MSRRVEFEWRISDPLPNGKVCVMERLCGEDNLVNEYGPMLPGVAASFIKARRMWVHQQVTTRAAAIQVFEPRPLLLLQAAAQQQVRIDNEEE